MEELKDKIQCDIKKVVDELQAGGYICGKLEVNFNGAADISVKVLTYCKSEDGAQIIIINNLI